MKTRFAKNVTAAMLTSALLTASALLLLADADDQFSDWSAPVNLGPVVNSGPTPQHADQNPAISTDGLSLYFGSDRPGGFGGVDIWVSRRNSVDEPWGPPENLGPNINTPFTENTPTLTIDGHRLFFQSNRPGGFGGLDLYVSRRHNKRDDFGWQPALNLGSGVNTFANDQAPVYFEDDVTGTITLYFASNRPGGIGATDVYASTLQPDETFGPAVLVEELSSPFADSGLAIRRDGLEIFVASNRPGSVEGSQDIWVASRASTADPWSEPVNLGPVVNSASGEGRSGLSSDGAELYFSSNRPGGFGGLDLYVSTRTKLQQSD